MKKLLIALLFIGFHQISHAQWVAGSASAIYYNLGNVGIGISTPISGISVETGANDAVAPVTSLPNGSAWLGATGSNGGISIGQYSGNYGYIQSRSKRNDNVAFKLALNPLGGFVGVGTATPGSALYVLDSNPTVITLERSGGTLNTSIQYKNATKSIYGGLNSNGGFSIGTTNDLITSGIFTVTSDGKVCIGTLDPKTYKFAVNGSAIVTSITVKANANWPDYVFKPGYKLPALNTVEAYVSKHQHLPEMPSEKEITENGVNLGEMNKLLLKKVEELTLYVLANDKELKAQKKLLLLQSKKIEQLKRSGGPRSK